MQSPLARQETPYLNSCSLSKGFFRILHVGFERQVEPKGSKRVRGDVVTKGAMQLRLLSCRFLRGFREFYGGGSVTEFVGGDIGNFESPTKRSSVI